MHSRDEDDRTHPYLATLSDDGHVDPVDPPQHCFFSPHSFQIKHFPSKSTSDKFLDFLCCVCAPNLFEAALRCPACCYSAWEKGRPPWAFATGSCSSFGVFFQRVSGVIVEEICIITTRENVTDFKRWQARKGLKRREARSVGRFRRRGPILNEEEDESVLLQSLERRAMRWADRGPRERDVGGSARPNDRPARATQ